MVTFQQLIKNPRTKKIDPKDDLHYKNALKKREFV